MSDPRKDGWIQTYTGRQFWPLSPRPEDVCIEDIAHALSNMCRFTGHCREFYSVAQHSVLVAEMFVQVTGQETGPNVLAALLHDASEAYLVDVPSPIKPFLAGYKGMESAVMDCICIRFGIDGAPRHHPMIKFCDATLLATEARDLMCARPAPWQEMPTPLYGAIRPLPPAEAERQFLGAFRYFGAREW